MIHHHHSYRFRHRHQTRNGTVGLSLLMCIVAAQFAWSERSVGASSARDQDENGHCVCVVHDSAGTRCCCCWGCKHRVQSGTDCTVMRGSPKINSVALRARCCCAVVVACRRRRRCIFVRTFETNMHTPIEVVRATTGNNIHTSTQSQNVRQTHIALASIYASSTSSSLRGGSTTAIHTSVDERGARARLSALMWRLAPRSKAESVSTICDQIELCVPISSSRARSAHSFCKIKARARAKSVLDP